MIRKPVKNLTLCLCMFIFLVSCTYNNRTYQSDDFVMGTILSQKIHNEKGEQIIKEVVEAIREIEMKMTVNISGGEINLLNEYSGKEFLKVSEDTFFVLKKSVEISEATSGAFDITVGPLVKEWNFLSENPKVPQRQKITELLPLVGYEKIIMDNNKKEVMLKDSSQMIDLGGIAKGFGADKAKEIYQKYGVKSALISLGGNVIAHGPNPNGEDWRIGVRNPRGPEGSYIGVLSVKDMAVVSSGDYERYFEKEGVRYHHILDPKTGFPSESDLIGTTIVSKNSIDADGLSTATFVLGLNEGMNLLESIDGVEGIFITKDKKVYTTKGLKEKFKFDDKSKEFTYVEKR